MSLEPDLPDSIPEPNVGDLLTADAVGAHAADPHAPPRTGGHGGHGPFHTHCENCGAELKGPWCHACGQHDFEFHRSFRHVLMEALEAFLHFDSSFFRSMAALLVRPGWLTEQFNAGKRAAQMPPFRLYLFVAFVFFLVMHFAGGGEGGGAEEDGKTSFMVVNGTGPLADGAAERQVWAELTKHFPADAWHDRAQVRALYAQARRVAASVATQLDAASSEGRQLSEEETLAVIRTAVAAESGAPAEAADGSAGAPANAAGTAPASAGEDPADGDDEPLPDWAANLASRLSSPEQRHLMFEKFVASIPKVLLVCMPVFALLTRALFRRSRDVVYLKHLVLALHFHTFVYLWILLLGAMSWIAALPGWGWEGWVQFAGTAWLVVYIPWMLRRLFANGWAKTLVKSALLVAAYGFTIIVAFGTAATAILLL